MITKEQLITNGWNVNPDDKATYGKQVTTTIITRNVERHFTQVTMPLYNVQFILYTPTIEILNAVAIAFGVN